MSLPLKIVLGGVLAIVLLLGTAVTVFALTFDPNDYKPQITKLVEEQTGRQLALGGPLGLKIFPWLAVEARDVALANAEGFTDERMLTLDSVEAQLRVWPLIRREIRIGDVVVRGLTVNLERRADGTDNWSDLAGGSKDQANAEDENAATTGSGEASALPDFSLTGVTIEKAKLNWRDNGQLTSIRDLRLSTGAIADQQWSDLEAAVAIAMPDDLELSLALTADWMVNLAAPAAQIADLKLDTNVAGPAIPAGNQALSLIVAAAQYDGVAQTASVDGGRLQMHDQAVNVSGRLSKLDSAMDAVVAMRADALNVATLAQGLAVELPAESGQWPALNLNLDATANLAAMRLPSIKLDAAMGQAKLAVSGRADSLAPLQANADIRLAPLDLHAFLAQLGYPLKSQESAGPTEINAQLALSQDALDIPKVQGQLAGETLSGSASIKNFANPIIRADLDLARVVVAHWQGQESTANGQVSETKENKGEGGGLGQFDQIEVPLDWAKDLNLTARAGIGTLDAYGVKLRKVLWTADARPGQPVRQKLSANAYGGELAVNNTVDATQAKPALGLNLSAKALGLGDLLNDGWGKRWITGLTQLELDLLARGQDVGQLRRDLNGKAAYRLQDGSVQGVSLLDLVRGASAKLSGGSHSAASDSTSFSELAGQWLIENGKLKTQSLGGGNDWFKFDAAGLIDLVKGQYDMSLKPLLLDNPKTRSDARLEKLIGLAIPVQLSGPLAAPKFSVDLKSLAESQARAKIDEEKARLNEKLDKEKDRLREKINDKLGDFFKPRATASPD